MKKRTYVGFSFVELVAALGVISILAAFSFLNGVKMIRDTRQMTMDRQAEQIFLALSRNFAALEASGQTDYFATTVGNCTDDDSLTFVSENASTHVKTYVYTNYTGSQNLDSLILPDAGRLSATLDEELQNSYWLIVFTPGIDDPTGTTTTISPTLPSGAQRPNTLTTDRLITYTGASNTPPTVQGVYFARDDARSRAKFRQVWETVTGGLSSGGRPNIRYCTERDQRLSVTEGYVGYYGGSSAALRTLSKDERKDCICYFVETDDGWNEAWNAEELTAEIACWIPDDDQYKNKPVKLFLQLDGGSSRASTVLEIDFFNRALFGDEELSVIVVLDNLSRAPYVRDADGNGIGSVYKKDGHTSFENWKAFLKNTGFYPGEELRLSLLEGACGDKPIPPKDNSEMRDGSSYEQFPKLNSLFANDSSVSGSDLTAKIAYGRHLQNLDTTVSHMSDFDSVKAVQTQDISFTNGHYPDGVTSKYQKWAETYKNGTGIQTFLPILNEKVTSYDGGGLSIYNLTVNYHNVAAIKSGDPIPTGYDVNAGLFGEFQGTTAQSLTLVQPVVTGTSNTTTVGGLSGTIDEHATTLQQITLINPVLTAPNASAAGGLAGVMTTSGATVANCALYMDAGTDPISAAKTANENPDSGMSFLSTGVGNNKNAGGLIGFLVGVGDSDEKTVAMSGSFASTVIKAGVEDSAWGDNCRAGGLVGRVGDGVTLTIDRCYAGSYLYGDCTGGLVGGVDGASVSLTNSYTAGFQYSAVHVDGKPSSAAGLVNGEVTRMENCYTISALNYNKMDRWNYVTAVSCSGSVDKAYYRLTEVRASNGGTENQNFRIDNTEEMNTLSQKHALIGKWYQSQTNVSTLLGGAFEVWNSRLENNADTKTSPYNLRNQGLAYYNYPRLKAESGARADVQTYYGDWKPEQGILAYYEKYEYSDAYTGTRTAYGFKVQGIENCLLSARSGQQFGDGWKVVGDGYGVFFEKPVSGGPLDGKSMTVTFGGISAANQEIKKPPVTVHTDQPFEVTDTDGYNYIIYPIDSGAFNTNLSTDTFYWWAKISVEDNATNAKENSVYRFNPHSACTPTMIPEWDDDASSETLSEIRDLLLQPAVVDGRAVVSIRTARQLNYLSRLYSSEYHDILSGQGVNVIFQQECDIDYRAYDWNDYAPQILPDGATSWGVPWRAYATQCQHYDTNWYNSESVVFTQGPIAEAQGKPFVNRYDGGCHVITGVSVIAANTNAEGEQAIGLFGWNSGTIQNVVLSAPFSRSYNDSSYVIGRKQDIGHDGLQETIYLGALVGRNAGSVKNSAVSGYYFSTSGDMKAPISDGGTEDAVEGYLLTVLNASELYAGGLVGHNTGVVDGASACGPRMFTYVDRANAYVGGFVGSNRGEIYRAYSIGWVDADVNRNNAEVNGVVSLAGFCATGSGSHAVIQNSYAATFLSATGPVQNANGFAPTSQNVSRCYYLNGAMASYLGKLHTYSAESERGDGRTDAQLRNLVTAATRVNSASWHDMGAVSYLYPGYVKGRDGKPRQYGSWLEEQATGQFGVFYWEHEEGGANPGYHLSFIGVYCGDDDTPKPVMGNTLCDRHNDGGIIQEYGYGYYQYRNNVGTEHALRIKEKSNLAIGEDHQTQAAAAFELQWPEYKFYPYTTRYTTRTTGLDGTNDYIWMSGGAVANSSTGENILNGSITFSMELRPDVPLEATFVISPFFANAIQLTSIKKDGAAQSITAADCTVQTEVQVVTTSGGTETVDVGWRDKNFYAELGRESNRYEVRTLRQLQYLNWNYETKNTTTLVTEANCSQFNYLTHYSGSGTINSFTHASVLNREPSKCYWWQTHDAVTPSDAGVAPIEQGGKNFTPIAAVTVASTATEPKSTLHAWFGGHYDGQSYVIKNFDIHSESFTVGVFGATVSADIENVILYSDNNNVIERVTDPTRFRELTGQDVQITEKKLGSYALGGLVALAYDYNPRVATLVIRNCSISDYTIKDSSTNPHGRGGGNVGGLFGAAYAKLHNCSSVVHIYMNCMPCPRITPNNGNPSSSRTYAVYGSYIHVGGLVGSIQYEAVNCYTGGSIEVDKKTKYAMYLDEHYKTEIEGDEVYMRDDYQPQLDGKGQPVFKNNEYVYVLKPENEWYEKLPASERVTIDEYLTARAAGRETVVKIRREDNIHIFIGGLAGSTYSTAYTNFNGKSADRQATFKNCYTYIQLPQMEGNIKSVSYIGAVADRFNDSTGSDISKVTQINCWYLEGCAADAACETDESLIKAPVNLNWYMTTHYDYQKTSSRNERALGDLKQKATKKRLVWKDPTNDARGLYNILRGNLYYLREIQYESGDWNNPDVWRRCAPAPYLPNVQNYTQMSNMGDGGMRQQLNGGAETWNPVTNSLGGTQLEGRFSFPGSDPSELGTDYPFPAVITQYDPVRHGIVYVHYGAWPKGGAYWAVAVAKMDLFDDMQSYGWAEKKFLLQGVTGDAPTENDFSIGSKAKIVGIETAGNGGYWVTIRALGLGNVIVKYGDARFSLSITASEIDTGATVETYAESNYFFTSDKDKDFTPETPGPGDVAVTFYARQKAKEGRESSPIPGEWSNFTMDIEHGKGLPVQSGHPQPIFFDADKVNIDGPRYAAHTNGVPGEFYAVATFHFNYHGLVEQDISVKSEPVYAFGEIGLSTENHNVSALARQSDANGGTPYAGVQTRRTDAAAPQTPENASLFLYATATDSDVLTHLTIPMDADRHISLSNPRILGPGGSPYDLEVQLDDQTWFVPVGGAPVLWDGQTADVRIVVADDVTRTENNNYCCRAIYAWNLTGVPDGLTFSVPVTDPDSDAVYDLSVSIPRIYPYRLRLYSNGGTVTINDDSADNGKTVEELGAIEAKRENGRYYVTLPKVLDEREGYQLDGWKKDSGGNDYDYPVNDGKPIELTSDFSLYAHWVPEYCTLHFYDSADAIAQDLAANMTGRQLASQRIQVGAADALKSVEEMNFTARAEELFMSGWFLYDTENPNAPKGFYEDGESVTFDKRGDAYLYPRTGIPITMRVNDVNDVEELHWLTNSSEGVSLDRYQNPTFPEGVTLLGWNFTPDGATEAQRILTMEADAEEIARPVLALSRQNVYSLYRQYGTLNLVNECDVASVSAPYVLEAANGQKFSTSFDDFQLSAGDTLKVTMDLPALADLPQKQDLITFSYVSNGVTDWNANGLHLSYPRPSSDKVSIRLGNSSSNYDQFTKNLVGPFDGNTTLELTFNKNGITILVSTNPNNPAFIPASEINSKMPSFYTQFENSKTLYIGSEEGTQRSYATDYEITVTRIRTQSDVAAEAASSTIPPDMGEGA